eukprot:Hpha_TRINITY_DN16129_c0_g4::TRINITY_DN16129_c0_g4_i1::g.8345::m.8345
MGCVKSKAAEPDEKDPEYDPKWDDMREKFRAARAGKGSDGRPESEPGACCVCVKHWWIAKKGAMSLTLAGASFRPTEQSCASPTSIQMSSRDRFKIQLWLDGISDYTGGEGMASKGLNRAPSDAYMMRDRQDRHRHSVRTIYTQDEDEELVRASAPGLAGLPQFETAKPQRLTDKRVLNKLQTQIRAHYKKEADDKGSPVAGALDAEREDTGATGVSEEKKDPDA